MTVLVQERHLPISLFMRIKRLKNILYLVLCALLMIGCTPDEVHPESDYVDAGIPHYFQNKDIKTDRFEYLWDFGDGNTSNEVSPTHTYLFDGAYPVNVTRYRKNGKFHSKEVFYVAMVRKSYRPIVYGAEFNSPDYYDYFFPGVPYYLSFSLSEEQSDNRDDYTFEVKTEDGATYLEPYSNLHTFQDTGSHLLQFKISDENGISGTFDTIIQIGGDSTDLQIVIPEIQSPNLGTILERYLLVFPYDYNYQDAIFAVQDYPNDGNPLINNGELYKESSGIFFYGTLGEIAMKSLDSLENGITIQDNIPSYELGISVKEFDELKIVIVEIGTLGKAMGHQELNVIPGLKASTSISMQYYGY